MFRTVIVFILVLATSAAGAAELTFDFATDKAGEAPAGFRSVLAGHGEPGQWRIVLDEVPSLLSPFSPKAAGTGQRPVLAQVSRDKTDERFPMLIYEGESFGDFTLTTRFKLVEGAAEQMAGIAFRFVDERNYYYIRASGLGNTFYFFKIIDGQRGPAIGNKVEIKRGVWHEMTVECRGTKIRAKLNGQDVLPELDDKSLASGAIGFWTKSDSVSYFSDTHIVYTPREILAQKLVREAIKAFPRLMGVKIYASTNQTSLKTVASTDAVEVGQPAPVEADHVMAERGYYYGRGNGVIALTLPLHDSNGDKVAAVRVLMKSFVGQTEKNAVVRAMPVVKGMEARIRSLTDLLQ